MLAWPASLAGLNTRLLSCRRPDCLTAARRPAGRHGIRPGVEQGSGGVCDTSWPTCPACTPAKSVQMPRPAGGQAVLNVSSTPDASVNFTLSYFAPASAANSVSRACARDARTRKIVCLSLGKLNTTASTPGNQVGCIPPCGGPGPHAPLSVRVSLLMLTCRLVALQPRQPRLAG